MTDDKPKSFDIFGIRPLAEAINTLTKGAVDGAGAFLSRICLPAAEEFGLMLRDKVSSWRAKNAVAIIQKAEKKLNEHSTIGNKHAHPRLVTTAINEGSWTDNDQVQDMWAGLLASSCTEDGKDEGNLIFMNMLSQLTSTQAIILDYSCVTAVKVVSEAGWIYSENLSKDVADMQKVSGIFDVQRLDRELDHLRSLNLIVGGFHPHSKTANITPTSLALHMYVRCQGYVGSPTEYFDLDENPQPPT